MAMNSWNLEEFKQAPDLWDPVIMTLPTKFLIIHIKFLFAN